MGVMDSAYVYLPDDEPDNTLRFNGEGYTLQPNSATEILAWTPGRAEQRAQGALPPNTVLAPPEVPPILVAKHFATTHGRWGVCVVSGSVQSSPGKGGKARNLGDQHAVDMAEVQYLNATKEWAEGVLLREGELGAKRKAAGLKEELTVEGEKARKWLLAHGY